MIANKKFLPAILAIVATLSLAVATALLTAYTRIDATFEVKKAIVLENENYINKSYLVELNFGTLYQGENRTTIVNITNRASVNLTLKIVCEKVILVYKSGYKLSKSPKNASADWGVNITTPGRITIPAETTLAIKIKLSIAANAQVANEEDEKYDRYLARIYVRPI
jgi:hypothetical protein